jgi:hypothetical protein
MREITFDCEVGALLRGGFRGLLEREKFRLKGDVDIEWHEDKGFLGSCFVIRLKGESSRVQSVYKGCLDLFKRMSEEG